MERTPLVQVWDAQILDYEYFALVKDGPGYADGSAMKVLTEMTSTEILAGSAKYIAYALGENLQLLLWKLESLGLKMVKLTWYHICQQHLVT